LALAIAASVDVTDAPDAALTGKQCGRFKSKRADFSADANLEVAAKSTVDGI